MSAAPAAVPQPANALLSKARAVWARMRECKAWQAKLRILPEPQLFLILSVIIGLISGLLVVAFRRAIDWTRLTVFSSSFTPPVTRILVVPFFGGLMVAFLVIKFFPGARGSGVNQTKAAVYIYNGYIPLSTVIGKFLCCALAIGTGQSLGPEDPSLQMGAGIASALGRRLRLSREKVRLIAPVGAAAGLAAAFNAPISAVLFVIEEVIGKWTAGVLGAIVLAAVSSVVVLRFFLGDQPLFRVPEYHLVHPAELLAYAALGVAGGLSSLFFIKLIASVRPRFKVLPRWSQYFQPALAGLLIGVIGLRLPQVMGAGYGFIDQAMHGIFTWRMLLLLAAFKILATGASFVSGTPGGMFAPTLFIGAMIGGAAGTIEHHFFPSLTGSVGAYALVGMGALFAGFLRVPMTSVFMVLEVSGNYSIILPVMVSNTIAYLISRRYQRTSLFDLLSLQDGGDLPSMEERREEVSIHVEDTMRAYLGIVLNVDEPLSTALARANASSEAFVVVEDGQGKWYGITKRELHRQAHQLQKGSTLRSVLSPRPLPHLHPDHGLEEALRRLGDWPLLPVVNRADFRKLEGVVGLPDIAAAFHSVSGV